jgi:hypothetical protein
MNVASGGTVLQQGEVVEIDDNLPAWQPLIAQNALVPEADPSGVFVGPLRTTPESSGEPEQAEQSKSERRARLS